jgi:tRNA modification GTPase
MSETIFAQATPPGRSGIAVIRVSGDTALKALEALGVKEPVPRRAALRWLFDPELGHRLDQALILVFQAPNSFTGEDVVELHLHGGPAVCRSVLAALGRLPGLRPAEAGEFTRRALMNGRLDLAQVEGLGDLLAAETAEQQRQALALMDGALSRLAGRWRERIVEALALVEAGIDFADEELPYDLTTRATAALEETASDMGRELAGSATAERVRDGFEVALVGSPNTGKSTLLNAIARREAAIVSPIPGTTRDILEVRLDLEGLPVTLLDMAGIRASVDPVEQLGVERARARAAAADLRVFLIRPDETAESLEVTVVPEDLVVAAKGDLGTTTEGLAVSGLTGAGIPELLEAVKARLGNRMAAASTLNRERQRLAVARALDAIEAARVGLQAAAPDAEIVAEDLRAATRALDSLVGRSDVEAVLDVIFGSFCIGK